MNTRDPVKYLQCPKCGKFSGDDWSQCNKHCPVEGSPHFNKTATAFYGSLIPFSEEEYQTYRREFAAQWRPENEEIPF